MFRRLMPNLTFCVVTMLCASILSYGAQIKPAAPVNLELAGMYNDDQMERAGEIKDFSTLVTKDRQRLKRVKQMQASGQLKSAEDYFHAAMIFQHGSESADYQTAHELALQAVRLNPRLREENYDRRSAKWLAAAAKDRYLRSVGKPQWYGTQFTKEGSGPWMLAPTDPTITDKERKRWDVPTLAEARKRAKAMNQGGNE